MKLSEAFLLYHNSSLQPQFKVVSTTMGLDADTIFTFEAISERAGHTLKHSLNKSRYVPASFPSDVENVSRATTPEGSADGDLLSTSNSMLQFLFSQPPRSGLAFVFGSDPKKCDAYIGPRSE